MADGCVAPTCRGIRFCGLNDGCLWWRGTSAMKMKWLSFCIALGLHYRWIRLLRRPQSRLGKLAEVCHLRSLLIRVAALGNINSSKLGCLFLSFALSLDKMGCTRKYQLEQARLASPSFLTTRQC